MENTNNTLELTELEQVSGGALFSKYSVDEYNKAGVMVIGVGLIYNDGYRYEGKEITPYEANCLTLYYLWYGRRASSIDEAEQLYIILYGRNIKF